MHCASHQIALKADAPLYSVKPRIKEHVPDHGYQRHHQCQQAYVHQRIAQQPGPQGRANSNRQRFKYQGMAKTFSDGFFKGHAAI